MLDSYAHDHGLVCKNVNCPSYGKAHYNCKCYASGGIVHCANGLPHLPGCEYYAEGGDVKPQKSARTFAMAAAYHGLMGLMKNVGRANLADAEKHNQTLHEARGHWERLQNPIDALEEPKKTLGVKLANHLASGEHDQAANLMHGHPMMGSIHKSKMPDALREIQSPLMSQEPNAQGLKSAMEFMHASHQGENLLHQGMNAITDKKAQFEADQLLTQSLKNHLKDLEENPAKLEEIGGNLGHYMPEHASQLSYTFARASEYLKKIKPKPVQLAPMNAPINPNKVAQLAYDRQVQNVAQPMLLLERVRQGNILPIDVTTVQSVYPELHQAMIEKATDYVIEAKTNGKAIPYKQRIGLGILMNQPLDFTMKPENIRAIMIAQAQPQPQQGPPQKRSSKASNVELKQINKTDQIAETPIESRQMQDKD